MIAPISPVHMISQSTAEYMERESKTMLVLALLPHEAAHEHRVLHSKHGLHH